MSRSLSPEETARIVGAAVLSKDESEVEVKLTGSIASVTGFTSDRFLASIYSLTEDAMTEVRVTFSGHPGHSFDFKLLTDEATEKRIRRYTKHYIDRHDQLVEMMEKKP